MTDDPITPQHPSPTSNDVLPAHSLGPDLRPSIDLRDDLALEPAPSWGALDIVVVIGAFCVAWLASGMVLGLVMIFMHLTPDRLADARFLLPPQLFVYVVVFTTMYLLVGTRGQRSFWSEIRWNWPKRRWPIYLPVGFLLALVIGFAQTKLPVPKSVPMMKYFGTASSAYALGLLAVLAAPIIEELFFRGFLYPVLARAISNWPATLVVAVFFGFVHAAQLGWAWGYVLLLSFVGFVLTVVRARTHSVAASFVLHTAYNCTIFIVMWYQTDHFQHMERAASSIIFR